MLRFAKGVYTFHDVTAEKFLKIFQNPCNLSFRSAVLMVEGRRKTSARHRELLRAEFKYKNQKEKKL